MKRTLSRKIFLLLVVNVGLIVAQNGKFEPPAGKILFIVGQDLGAIGGFKGSYNAGYTDSVKIVPGGITTYTNLPELKGLYENTNYGAGEICGQCIVKNPTYENSTIAIGLYMVNQLAAITEGKHDWSIRRLGEWIKAQSPRPVFLRIGYEFDGEWNKYDPELYKKSYRRIADTLRAMRVKNVAFVWQSSGRFDKEYLYKWYPGDRYVDWVSYSHFDNKGEGMIAIAREKKKPLMIAEATPVNLNTGTMQPDSIWKAWYDSFFAHIYANSDVIKAVAYINQDWDAQPLWVDGVNGKPWGNSKVQEKPQLLIRWKNEMLKDCWLQATPDLFSILYRKQIKP